jgi:hypothetical protein
VNITNPQEIEVANSDLSLLNTISGEFDLPPKAVKHPPAEPVEKPPEAPTVST